MEITEQKLKKFRKRCLIAAEKKFKLNKEDAEEFAQEYLTMLIDKGWSQTIDQGLIDFVRRRIGRTRELGDSGRKMQPITFTDFNALRGEGAIERLIESSSESGGESLRIEECLRNASNDKMRLILGLIYKWGLRHADIGEILGVSESRISQLYRKEMQAQKERIQEETARENERDRQSKSQGSLSQKIQIQSEIQRKAKAELEIVFGKKGERMVFESFEIVSQALFRTFRVNTF